MDFSLPNADYAKLRLSRNGFGFEEVLDSFATAKRVVVVTYHLDLKVGAKLLARMRKLPPSVQATIITSVPSRWERYKDKDSAIRAKETIDRYLNALHPKKFGCSLEPWFCFENHAKIIATDSLAYIGSQNFADTSCGNFECGMVLRGEELVASTVDRIVESLCAESERYFGHLRQKYLVLLRSTGLTVRGFLKQIEEWMTPVMTYGGDYEDQLDLSLAEANPILPESLEAMTDDLNALLSELAQFEELEPALQELPHDALQLISELAVSDELAEFANHDASQFIENKLAGDPPAPEDMAAWIAEASEEEGEYRQKLHDEAEPAIKQLIGALESLINPLRELYRAVRDVPTASGIDNTASYLGQ